VRFFGNYWRYTLVAAVALALAAMITRNPRWWAAFYFILIGGALSGLNAPLKWIVGRHRPYHGFGIFELHPCSGSLRGLVGMESGLSFPSGDVCLAAATSTCLAILFPRWRWPLAAVVLLVAIERVAEGAHYPSDTVGGALLGWAVAHLAWRWMGRLVRPESSGAPNYAEQ
jgi:membrane-associated phospholipid phosphatase